MSQEPPLCECLRCKVPLRRGTPDSKVRVIVQSATTGFCPNCMVTRFLLGIGPIRDIIGGTPARGGIPAREGKGQEIFLDARWRAIALRPVLRGVLALTQLPEDSIDWIEVVGNWGMPWPKGREPKEGDV